MSASGLTFLTPITASVFSVLSIDSRAVVEAPRVEFVENEIVQLKPGMINRMFRPENHSL